MDNDFKYTCTRVKFPLKNRKDNILTDIYKATPTNTQQSDSMWVANYCFVIKYLKFCCVGGYGFITNEYPFAFL